MKIQQPFPDRLSYQSANFSFITKSDLTLSRVNVHIDHDRVDFQEQATHRVTALH